MSPDTEKSAINTENDSCHKKESSPIDSNDTAMPSYNPTLAENEYQQNELDLLKGDAIGETLYSERFVLKTLIKLGELEKALQEEEEFERDLCSLWDMTLEEDVVKYMLKHEVLELFAGIIKNTEDKRLTEILVGILGNMCNIKQTRNMLTEKTDVVGILLDLTSCMDSLTLEQLMRLLAVIFIKMSEDQIEDWYTLILKSDKFVENLCFILNNAAHNSLILQTLESLNAMLAKFFVLKLSLSTENGKQIKNESKISFEELFVRSEVVECTIEAFKTLAKQDCDDQDWCTTSEIPANIYKAKQTFCNIHSILTQHQQLSKNAYESSNDEILNCFKDILRPMLQEESITTWQQHEQDVLETLNDVLRVIPRPIDLEILKDLLKLLYVVDELQAKQIQNSSQANGFESSDGDDEIDHQISYTLILNSLYFLIIKAEKDVLTQYISECPRIHSDKLLQTLEDPLETEYIQSCYLKLKMCLKK